MIKVFLWSNLMNFTNGLEVLELENCIQVLPGF